MTGPYQGRIGARRPAERQGRFGARRPVQCQGRIGVRAGPTSGTNWGESGSNVRDEWGRQQVQRQGRIGKRGG